MTNDGVTVRSSLRAGPGRGAIAAIAVGVIVLGTAAVAGIRALRPTAPAPGIVMGSHEPSRASLAPLEPVTLPSLPAEEIAAPSASSPTAPTAAPPASSIAPARAAPHAPSQPMKPSDTSKVDPRVAPGKAQIGSAGVDTQY